MKEKALKLLLLWQLEHPQASMSMDAVAWDDLRKRIEKMLIKEQKAA